MDLSSFSSEFDWYTEFGIRVTLTARGHVEMDRPYGYVVADCICDPDGYRITPPAHHPLWRHANAALEEKALSEVGPLNPTMFHNAWFNADEGK